MFFPGCTGAEVVLSVRLNNPIMHHNSRGQVVELSFSCEHQRELEEAARRVFMVSVCIFTCLSFYLSVCLLTPLSACLSADLSVLCIVRELRAPPVLKSRLVQSRPLPLQSNMAVDPTAGRNHRARVT